ncbi:uncharacterized protein N7483_003173 [Penicillium malachiteum]|uniref:uncharacterized protein n=1 Tax=Penicillium malachiteum TaxID=1324776 RepID=UPI0025478DC1|nr:uncharacterized protein N7483_003173 [Penicillium malachiteum]KAJ5728665.1 hypothetical protein N7483_003173 [Penicillium malachiteum]
MLSSIVLFSTLVVSALGQNSGQNSSAASWTFPAGFNIGLVKSDELNSWCQGQRNQCPAICKTGTKQNTCDPTTLKFSCVCADGSSADVTPFLQTVPFYVCEANYGQCVDAHPDDSVGQEACKKAAKCGTKNATALAMSSSTTSAVASHTMSIATTTDSDSDKAVTSSVAAASTTTTNAAVPLGGMLETASTGILASIMFLAMRLVM